MFEKLQEVGIGCKVWRDQLEVEAGSSDVVGFEVHMMAQAVNLC